jgi:type VI secretion system protein ImpI
MGFTLKIENEKRLPDGGPLTYRVTGKRSIDIGRDPHLDWVLPDATRHISGKHCEIRYRDGGYWLYDISTNGTFLNDSVGRIQSPHLLRDGDRLTIGHYIITVEVDDEVLPAVAEAAPKSPAHDDIWADTDGAAPPVERKELNLAAETGPARPDFLEWAVDLPGLPNSGFALRPVSAPTTPAGQAADEDVDWAPKEQAQPAPRAEKPTIPDPRRPLWAAPEAAVPIGAGDSSVGRAQSEQVQAAARSDSPPPGPGSPLGWPELARSFAKGAGLTETSLTPAPPDEFVERLGRLMLLVVENLRQLLSARLHARRLGRSSNQTMIQALNNNPLKFSPSSAEALRIMFGPSTGSYLEAGRALQESFGDLKAHQIKTLSAMQSALRMLVEDLDPRSIEDSLASEGGIGAFLGSRKARLWDAYVARWKAKAGRHEDGIIQAFMLDFAERYDLAHEEEKR